MHGLIEISLQRCQTPCAGHWESELLIGDRRSQISTLVECQMRAVMLVTIDGTDTETVVHALIKDAPHDATGISSR